MLLDPLFYFYFFLKVVTDYTGGGRTVGDLPLSPMVPPFFSICALAWATKQNTIY